MRRGVAGGLVLALVVGAGLYLAALAYLYAFQRSYVFHPGGTLILPAELGLDAVQPLEIEAGDGTRLTAWFAPPQPGQPIILYFSGNAGNISGRADRFRRIIGSGFGLMAPSYRGYPGSGGTPSEAALFSDALEVFDWLAARGYAIVLHGESLGSGVATYVAAEREARALSLEAPYTAALDIAAATYPWIPVSLLMHDPFLSREHIKRVSEPVLIVHGTADSVIPVEYGRRLFEEAGEPKEIVIVNGAGHADLWDRGLWQSLTAFLDTHT